MSNSDAKSSNIVEAVERFNRARQSAFPTSNSLESAPERFELQAKLKVLRQVVQDLIDLLDEIDGDADLEEASDCGADDFGEPPGSSRTCR